MIMFRLWHQGSQQRFIIVCQAGFIAAILLLCLGLMLGWHQASRQLTVYVPPDLSNGVMIQAGEVPKPLLYSFAFQVWQEIHYWPTSERQANGAFAYTNNIDTYWSYLTPTFRQALLADAEQLGRLGQLRRTRQLVGMAGVAFDSSQVEQRNQDEWLVTLDVRLHEVVDTMPVKDIRMRYPLTVVRLDISREHNPYGLALAGFDAPPERIDIAEELA